MNIQVKDIEMVTPCKYLGVHLNNKLDWTHKATALYKYKKGQIGRYLLRSVGGGYDLIQLGLFSITILYNVGGAFIARRA